jgi:hypothetical protein
MATNFNQFKDNELTLICLSTLACFHSCFYLLNLPLPPKMRAAHYSHDALIAWTK